MLGGGQCLRLTVRLQSTLQYNPIVQSVLLQSTQQYNLPTVHKLHTSCTLYGGDNPWGKVDNKLVKVGIPETRGVY